MKLAGAPISWGVCEVDDWGVQLSTEGVLGAIAAAGLTGTELGPDGFLPENTQELADLLAALGLSAVGSFVTITAHDSGRADDAVLRVKLALERASTPAFSEPAIVLALVAGSDGEGYDAEVTLGPDEWTVVSSTLARIIEISQEVGVPVAVHPHYGTLIESPESIQELLEQSDISLCLDTGHVAVGGGDALAITQRYVDRIAHVHLKDVNLGLAAKVQRREIAYSDAVSQGLYCTLGQGDAKIESVVTELCAANYAGWYVLEQDIRLRHDVDPKGEPLELCLRSKSFVERVLTNAQTGVMRS